MPSAEGEIILGVSFLITFFFAPVSSKKKVAKEFCKLTICVSLATIISFFCASKRKNKSPENQGNDSARPRERLTREEVIENSAEASSAVAMPLKTGKYAGNRKTIPVSFDNAHRFQKRKNWKRSYLCAQISKGV